MLTPSTSPSPAAHPLHSSPKIKSVTCFSIAAEADPSTLPRVLDLVAMFDLIPERCHMSRSDSEPGRPLLIDLQIADLDDEITHRIRKKLERMLLTTQILCSEKRLAAA